ncbi:hypothetical protein A2688_02940 [Candidatus Daviesbacteria bacterium RIFCSPHIGHO2_01_FULL_38_8]|nr:MAG: hypothetical protein A2688_02940 [Candidatus Daviesbacteria bacterium RIFCSPHIGHO2_01_FULL_38_8]
MGVNDPSIFVKKAVPAEIISTQIVHNSFEDFTDLVGPLKKLIEGKGYTIPTPIQDQTIQPILDGRDVVGLASTGTGKTAAFLIPIVNRIFRFRDKKALVVVPTRELAHQIRDELFALTESLKIYSALVIGGANINRQIRDIQRNPHIVIGTPGRLKDLIEQKVLFLEDFSIFVLDEVDLMVDIGFIQYIKLFVSLLPARRQSLFFSATISPKINEIVQGFVKNPVTVSIAKPAPSQNVDQDIIKVTDKTKKIDQLHDLLIQKGFNKVLIFGRTKHDVDNLNNELIYRGFNVGAIHGNKSQGHRQRVLESFKSSQIQILLATDVASRGLDIDNVSHVINYDIPETFDDYIHRIGRTGRANKKGTAITFV